MIDNRMLHIIMVETIEMVSTCQFEPVKTVQDAQKNE